MYLAIIIRTLITHVLQVNVHVHTCMQICVRQNDATLGEGCVSLKSLCTQDYLESRVEITSANLDSGTVVQYVIAYTLYMYDVQCQPTAC